MEFKISKEFLTGIEQLISENKSQELLLLLEDIHFADIAEIMEELDDYGASYIFNTLDSEKTAEILLELDDEVREKILRNLSPKEIAEELDELSTDDAADIIAELPQHKKEQVISELEDVEHAVDRSVDHADAAPAVIAAVVTQLIGMAKLPALEERVSFAIVELAFLGGAVTAAIAAVLDAAAHQILPTT